MEPTRTQKRREARFEIEAGATVGLHKKGRTVKATTVNRSGCGVLLRFPEPVHLDVGDTVMCDFQMSKESGELLPCWAEGTVVRVDGTLVALQFQSGGWTRGKGSSSPSDKTR
jgi:hypothetical protein